MLPGVDRERQGTTRHRGRAIDRQQNQGAREQRVEHQYPLHGRHKLDHQESIDSLPPGKRQVMEKFFRPVHSPSSQDMNLGKHHHHHPHHQHQDRESHNNTLLEGNNSPSGAHHHHHHREHHHHDNHHHGHPHHHHRHHHPPEHLLCGEEDELHEHHRTSVTLSRASSSSLSSSSSSVSSSWSTEASANDPFSLRHAERPQHSLSCSNIVDVHGRFPEDDSKGPIAFATVNVHGHPRVQVHQGSPRGRREGPSYSTLNRGHSRSEEGLLQTSEDRVGGGSTGRQHRDGPLEHGVLYKTLSLGGSLAFSEEEIHLGAGGPKRAVSSMQLPSKGILKNRETQPDIRKARSMEVLSPRVAKGQGQRQGKDEEKAKVQTEKARENFVKGKIQFSAFLDEITKQVISPSRLNILGVGNTKTSSQSPASAQVPAQAPAKPKLPPKKHRGSLGEEREPPRRTTATPGKQSSNETYLGPQKLSHPDKLITYAAKSSYHGSPPPRPQPGGHPGGGPTERKSSLTEGPVASDRQGRYGPLLTDETSTSPELCLQKQHQYKHKSHRPTGAQGQQKPPSPGNQRPAHSPPPPPGLDHGSESPSSKSDSSRNQDLAGSPGSEHNDRYRLGAGPKGRSSKHREMSDADQLRFLQDENADLHQNLLQTVVCIESLEVELQRTREELCQTKENYTRLLETHTGTRHTNNLLGEKLQSANDSMSSERKYLIQRVAQLSSELEDAHRTISALEIVNVPCLIKDLLEKHIDSGEAAQKFLQSNQPIFSPYMDSQSQAPRADRVGLLTDSQQRMTAFTPWTQEEGAPINEIYETNAASGPYQCQSPPFSVADISMAIYKKMAGEQAKGVLPHAQSHHQHSLLGTNHHSSPTVPGPVADKGQRGRDVSYVSAQRALDDFMEQLQPPDEGGVEGGHQGLDWDRGLDKGKGGE